MKSYYSKKGDKITVVGSADSISDHLPASTYVVKQSRDGYYLELTNDMELPPKIYGNSQNRAERVFNTFEDRNGNTGALLTGEKGSGKTLLTKQISEYARSKGIPTIIVSDKYIDADFTSFITSITQEAIIVFDEFEKVYGKFEEQNLILSLLDGVLSGKKLFLITVNNTLKLSEFFINRPSRLYYSYEYTGLEDSFIHEYCNDHLGNKDEINNIVSYANFFGKFNFDMLKSIVEEMNRYGEPLKEVLTHLNINSMSEVSEYEAVNLVLPEGHTEYTDDEQTVVVENATPFSVNGGKPFSPLVQAFWLTYTYEVGGVKSKTKGDVWIDASSITSIDNGLVSYELRDGMKLTIKRSPKNRRQGLSAVNYA